MAETTEQGGGYDFMFGGEAALLGCRRCGLAFYEETALPAGSSAHAPEHGACPRCGSTEPKADIGRVSS